MANALHFQPLEVREKWKAMAKRLKGDTKVLGVFSMTKYIGKFEPSITG